MSTVELVEAYILHTRPYRETSLLIDVFSLEQGRFRVVAKGARRAKTRRGLMQAFIHLLIASAGRSELKTLTHIEAINTPIGLVGRHIVNGLYVNEIIQRLCPTFDPMPDLFAAYHHCITTLQKSEQPERCLRDFEFTLLAELGYALDFSRTFSGQPIQPQLRYDYSLEQGFFVHREGRFDGELLLAIAQQDWDNSVALSAAKRITRMAIGTLLGHKPIASRACYFQEVVNE